MKRRFTRFTVIFIGMACVLALAEIAMAAAVNYQIGDKQLLADGSMEASGTGSWTNFQASLSKTTTSPHGGKQVLRIAFDGTNADAFAYQIILTAGKKYRIRGWARGDGTAIPLVHTSADVVWTGTASASWQPFDVTLVVSPSGTQLRFRCSNLSATHYVEFDDVYVTEYQGKEQNSEKQLLADGSMEKSGTGSWTAIQSVLSKQTTSPHGGNQVLRVAYDGATAWGYAKQSVVTVGKRYRVTGWARGDGTSVPSVSDIIIADAWVGTSSISWQHFDVVMTWGTTTFGLVGSTMSAGHYVEFDDLMVTEYQGKEQNSEKQLLADGSMEKTNSTVALVNGDFEGAAGPPPNGWTQGTSVATRVAGTRTGGTGSYVAHIAYNGSSSTGGLQQNVLTSGHTYRITGWARGDGTATPGIYHSGSGWPWTGTSSATWQSIDATFLASATDIRCWSTGQTTGTYVEFDDIAITDVTAGSWTAGSATLSKDSTIKKNGAQSLKITGGQYTYASQVILTTGKRYRLTGWARGDGNGYVALKDNGAGGAWFTAATTASWQHFDVVATATGPTFVIYQYGAGTYSIWVDDLMITEVPAP